MRRLPLIHITDLYHPPQDPDDQVDLATVFALDAFDLRAVILDTTKRFQLAAPSGYDIRRDPGYTIVAQLCHLSGRAVPVAAGPSEELASVTDDVSDRHLSEQAGVELILRVLEESDTKVTISVVGSVRPLTAAFNRNPELLLDRVDRVLLNAGTSGGDHVEWNVALDSKAYVRLWQSGLKIDWFPCSTENSPFDPEHENSAYFSVEHSVLLDGLSKPLRGWFAYGFGGSSRSDIISVLPDLAQGATWEHVLAGHRNMWATASLLAGAGLNLVEADDGWRFSAGDRQGSTWTWNLVPVHAEVRDDHHISWSYAEEGAHRLFRRRPGQEFGAAMGQALNHLLRRFDKDVLHG